MKRGAVTGKARSSATRSQAPLIQGDGPDKAVRRPLSPRFSLSLWAGNHQEVAIDSLTRLLSQFLSSLMTWLVIGIALALPLALFLLVLNLQTLGGGIDQSARLSLFLASGPDSPGPVEIMAELGNRQNIAEARYISAEEGLEDFRAATGFEDVLAGLEENPLPGVIQLVPETLEAAAISALADELAAIPGVERVVLDIEWVQRLQALLDLLRRLTLGLAVLLCLGVVLVTGNTVRMAIENRRAEIVVIKLVGGTNAWVARPFLYTGLWYGVGGGIVAVSILTVGLLLLSAPVSRLSGLYQSGWLLQGWDLATVMLVLCGSGFIGWLGAWVSVRRHLRHIEPR